MKGLYSSSLPWSISSILRFCLLIRFQAILVVILQSVINEDANKDMDG